MRTCRGRSSPFHHSRRRACSAAFAEPYKIQPVPDQRRDRRRRQCSISRQPGTGATRAALESQRASGQGHRSPVWDTQAGNRVIGDGLLDAREEFGKVTDRR